MKVVLRLVAALHLLLAVSLLMVAATMLLRRRCSGRTDRCSATCGVERAAGVGLLCLHNLGRLLSIGLQALYIVVSLVVMMLRGQTRSP